MSRVLVLAEPGATHEGDWATMVRLLETAAQCGADVFKPQWTSDAVRMCERRHIGLDHPKRDYYLKAYAWLQFPVEWHAELKKLCSDLAVAYGCTVFLPQDAATVAPHVEHLKISSFEAEDEELGEAASGLRPLIISTGMWDGKQVPWWWMGESVLLCTSAYPAPLDELHLQVVAASFDSESDLVLSGLSDHSRNTLTGAVAVGAGAEIIETHFRLDNCDPENPDYAVAFTPNEFALYIQNIRTAERMMGNGIKKIQPSEEWALPYRV